LIFDHGDMITQSLEKLRQKAGSSLIGSELLPPKFTLLELRKLYEAIYQRVFDPGNFRKKMLSLGIFERLNQKDISQSKKGAYYYRVKANKAEEEQERIIIIR
jgi:8-oxo-dGTP diphosphatase